MRGESRRQTVLRGVGSQEGAHQVPARIPRPVAGRVRDELQDDPAHGQGCHQRLASEATPFPGPVQVGAAVAAPASLRVVPPRIVVPTQVRQQRTAAAPRPAGDELTARAGSSGSGLPGALSKAPHLGESFGQAGLFGHDRSTPPRRLLDCGPVRFMAGLTLQYPGVPPGGESDDVLPVQFQQVGCYRIGRSLQGPRPFLGAVLVAAAAFDQPHDATSSLGERRIGGRQPLDERTGVVHDCDAPPPRGVEVAS